MQITIRTASVQDAKDLITLGEEWLHPLFYKGKKEVFLKDENYILSKHHKIWVLIVNGEVIGFCDVVMHTDWLTLHKKGIINHVYVKQDFQKRGFGTIFLTEVLRQLDVDTVYIETRSEIAEKLYTKVGFIYNGERKWFEIKKGSNGKVLGD